MAFFREVGPVVDTSYEGSNRPQFRGPLLKRPLTGLARGQHKIELLIAVCTRGLIDVTFYGDSLRTACLAFMF